MKRLIWLLETPILASWLPPWVHMGTGLGESEKDSKCREGGDGDETVIALRRV